MANQAGVRTVQVATSLLAAALVVTSIVGFVQRGGGEEAASGSDAATTPGQVTIVDFTFKPAMTSVAVGDTVTWVNEDEATHTVTSTGSGPLMSGDMPTGGRYEETFDEAGSYPYKCDIHPYMTATVEVQ